MEGWLHNRQSMAHAVRVTWGPILMGWDSCCCVSLKAHSRVLLCGWHISRSSNHEERLTGLPLSMGNA